MQKSKEFTKANVKSDANRDPISGEPGAHPVGVGTGGVGGGLAGAAIGAVVGGPIGAGVGAIVGVVSGGLAGKSAAEAINPTTEHAYWRKEFVNRPYATQGTPYEQFGPAYQFGWESFGNHRDKSFKEVEPQLRRDWDNRRGQSKLSWDHARNAVQEAWQRAENGCCEDSSCSR